MNIPSYTDRFFLLIGYNNVGTVQCTYQGFMRYNVITFCHFDSIHVQAKYTKAIGYHILQFLIWDS